MGKKGAIVRKIRQHANEHFHIEGERKSQLDVLYGDRSAVSLRVRYPSARTIKGEKEEELTQQVQSGIRRVIRLDCLRHKIRENKQHPKVFGLLVQRQDCVLLGTLGLVGCPCRVTRDECTGTVSAANDLSSETLREKIDALIGSKRTLLRLDSDRLKGVHHHGHK